MPSHASEQPLPAPRGRARRRRERARAALVLSSALDLVGCLPGDTRPEPAALRMFASASDGTQGGFDTADGWRVSFDRLVTGVGDGNLGEDTCTAYSSTDYTRLFDFTAISNEYVGVVYGIGTCDLEFEMRGPNVETILGAGVSQADVDVMRPKGSDAFVDDSRTSVLVIGSATQDDRTKSFRWAFRNGFEVRKCERLDGDGYESFLELEGGAERVYPIEVRGEELFRVTDEDDAPLHFDAFASADVDADDRVTLEELGEVPAPSSGETDELADDTTLAELVYLKLLPRLSRMAGAGPCETEILSRNRR
jgi:hypothetical protein